uniref:Uncharacterized protein n=1 Tax=Oncorhynchus mykiss TaxID=8022 RepID=A0A8K9UYR7_ONCMY
VVGILSIMAQTVVLGILMRSIANKNTILLGLGFQILQLAWYGFGSQPWMMWAAGAVSSITFPAISAILSRNADSDQQGELLRPHTNIRLLIFYFFKGLNCSKTMPTRGRTYIERLWLQAGLRQTERGKARRLSLAKISPMRFYRFNMQI